MTAVCGNGDIFRQHNIGACLTASFANVEIGGIRVDGQYHCAGAKGDTIYKICFYIVKDLINGVIDCFCGISLFLAKFSESNKEVVIDSSVIVEQCSYNGLDVSDSCGV